MTDSADHTAMLVPIDRAVRSPWASLRRGVELTGQTLKLMIGVGDYEAYVNHMQEHHDDAPVMSYKDWYRNRVDARYGAGKDGTMKRCPC